MNQLTRGYRVLAMLVLVAMAGLLPAIARAAGPTADKLQVLVNDTAAQLQLAYRQHPDERARRKEQLTAAVAAWRAAPRSEANNERLATWLRAAILNSMPGSSEPLPAVPSFAVNVKTEPQPETHDALVERQVAHKEVETKTSVETAPKPAGETEIDPFRDDPETENN